MKGATLEDKKNLYIGGYLLKLIYYYLVLLLLLLLH